MHWLIICTFERFWCDEALQNKNQISENGMFPSVYVWVRQLGALKLHPYNSIAQICILFMKFVPIWHSFGKIYNFEVMIVVMVLIIKIS